MFLFLEFPFFHSLLLVLPFGIAKLIFLLLLAVKKCRTKCENVCELFQAELPTELGWVTVGGVGWWCGCEWKETSIFVWNGKIISKITNKTQFAYTFEIISRHMHVIVCWYGREGREKRLIISSFDPWTAAKDPAMWEACKARILIMQDYLTNSFGWWKFA